MSLMESILNGADVREVLKSVNEDKSFDTFIDFITGMGTIVVRDGESFKRFVDMLKDHKCERVLGPKANSKLFSYWKEMAQVNHKNPDCFVFEYQPGKGLSWYDNVEEPTNWYGKKPVEI